MPAIRRISNTLLCGVFLSLCAGAFSASASELTLRDEALAQTRAGRDLLKYLVSCSLQEGVNVVTTVGTERFSFAGKMGLAPGWSVRPMTDREERLVSACLLARTNRFGVPVEISSRNDSPDAPVSLQADENERQKFPFHEGGFFGNMFKDDAEAYVCIGQTSSLRRAHLERLRRECALPPGGSDAPQKLSRCNFIIVGDCQDRPFIQHGVDYTNEVINVYLPAEK